VVAGRTVFDSAPRRLDPVADTVSLSPESAR
jgi:hypothetical protein